MSVKNTDVYKIFRDTLNFSKPELVGPLLETNLDAALASFRDWIVSQKIEMKGVYCCRKGNMNCVFVDRPLKEGEVVLKVPQHAMITEADALQSALGQFLLQDASFRAFPHLILSLYILSLRNRQIQWSPYIQLLPTNFSTPFYYSEDEIEVLTGTLVFEEIGKRMKTILGQYYHLRDLLSQKMSEFFGVTTQLSFHDFLWCLSVTMTRQNRVPKDDAGGTMLALIPVWDFCNHCDGEIKTFYDFTTNSIVNTAAKNYQTGEEFFISYGPRPNSELLIYSGFIDEHNSHDCVSMKLSVLQKDPTYEERTMLLQKLELLLCRLFFPLDHVENESIFSFTKVLTMNDAMVRSLLEPNAEMPYLADTSPEHRKRIIEYLKIRVQVQSKIYPGNEAEDLELLKNLHENSNKHVAVKYRCLERRLLGRLIAALEEPEVTSIFDFFQDTRQFRSPI